MTFKYLRLSGEAARAYANEIALLRVNVFSEYPYLYQGNLEYEKKYLETYFKAERSFILLIQFENRIVGATTSIWAEEEEESFREPFIKFGLDPRTIFYFGESVLEKEFRGKGLGKVFFEERERYARSLSRIDYLSFCAVVRPENHALKPDNYKPLDAFWNSQGFFKEPGLVTHYEWKDKDMSESSSKLMQFWLKKL